MIAAAAASAFSAITAAAVAVAPTLAGLGLGMTYTGLNVATAISALKMISTASAIYSLVRKPKANVGSPSAVAFKSDPNAPITFVAGKAGVGGNIVFGQTHAPKNRFLTYVTALSHGGPVKSIAPFTAADEVVTFGNDNGEGAVGRYNNRMWQKFALGAVGAAALAFTSTANKYTPARAGNLTEWTAQHRLSGIAHTLWSMWSDVERYPNGVPKPFWVVHGGPVYDPRKDSTYPGGNGPQRWNDRNTWSHEGNENPYLHAITFLIGHTFNGVKVGGVGADPEGIDLPAYVEGANVADANQWKLSLPWTTAMRKWDVLATMLQAGGGQPLVRGAKISCRVQTPRVSIGTISEADLVADFSVTGTKTKRDRKNTIIPRCRMPSLKWTVQPYGEVTAQAYLDTDGERRAVEIEYEGVNGYDGGRQLRQLAAYDLTSMREGLVATLPCSIKALKYRAGDCLTIDAPETLMNGQKVVVIKRDVDPVGLIVTLTVQSETDGKHDFALGRTAAPPPEPVLTGVDPLVLEPPAPDAWAIEPGVTPGGGSPNDPAMPVIVVTPGGGDQDGSYDEPSATAVLIRYRRAGNNPATGLPWPWSDVREYPPNQASYEITGLAPGVEYQVQIAYRARGIIGDWRDFGTVTTGGLVATDAIRLGNREAGEILGALDAVPGLIDNAVADLNEAIGAIDFDINDPTTGLRVRVGQAETVANNAASRVDTVEIALNTPGTGLLARTASLETATADLALGKADASRLLLVEARATGEGALNNQATFATPWANGAIPPGWNDWSTGTGNTRDAGLESAYGVRYVMPAGQDRGIVQNPTSTPALGGTAAGWYVLEATIRLNSGSLVGAGLLAQALNGATDIGGQSINFATEPDISGAIVGAGVAGRIYRFSKLVRMENGNAATMNGIQFYAMAGWSAFAPGGVAAKDVTFTRAVVRPASSAEIDVGVARSGGADLSARFGSLEAATVDLQANKAAASRVSYLEAGSEDVYFNRNPTFTLYDDAATTGFTLPNYWFQWGARVDDSHREPGYAGRYAWWSHNNKPGVTGDVGCSQDYNNNPRLSGMADGYYVLELDLALDAGQIGGAGVYVYFANGGANSQARIDCGVDKTVDGVTLGYGYDTASARHSWRKLVKLENGAGGNMVFHLMTDWDGFDATGRPKVVRFQRAGIRRATAQEVAAERADTNAGSALARVTTQESVTAELVARGGGGGNLIGNANLITQVGWRLVPFNLIEAGLDRPNTGINFPDASWHPPGDNCLSSHVNGRSEGWYLDWVSDDVTVEQLKTYEFGVRCGQHRTVSEMYIGFTNGTDTGYVFANLTDGSGRYAGENYAGGTNIGGYGYFWGKVTIPAGYNRAFLILRRATTNAGLFDSWSWFTRPFIREIPADQTRPSPWDAGSSQWNLRASWQAGVAVPGADAFISAVAQLQNGKPTSSVAIGAQQFAVYNQVGQNWLKALEVIGGNVVLTGGLQAGAFIRLGNGNGWPVALKPVDFNASDGEVVAFGTDLGGLPALSFALNNLAPLNAGETYDVRASGLTATGFTMYAKINVPATPATQTHNADKAAVTLEGKAGVQMYLGGKPEAADGTYRIEGIGPQQHRFIGKQGEAIEADSYSYAYSTVALWAYKGAWVKIAERFLESVVDPYQYPSGQLHITDGQWFMDETIQLGSGVTHVALTFVLGDNGRPGSVSTVGPVSWQSQGTGSGVRSATPNGQKTRVTVRPQ